MAPSVFISTNLLYVKLSICLGVRLCGYCASYDNCATCLQQRAFNFGQSQERMAIFLNSHDLYRTIWYAAATTTTAFIHIKTHGLIYSTKYGINMVRYGCVYLWHDWMRMGEASEGAFFFVCAVANIPDFELWSKTNTTNCYCFCV